MATIDLFCYPSPFFIDKPSLKVDSNRCSVEGQLRRSEITYMASFVLVKKESQ